MKFTGNATPYVTSYDKGRNETTIGDRLFRPLVTVPGRYPRCRYDSAVACDPDEDRLYGQQAVFLYSNDDAPRCDPAVRCRLADLLAACPVLREEVERRQVTSKAAQTQPVDLIEMTFG